MNARTWLLKSLCSIFTLVAFSVTGMLAKSGTAFARNPTYSANDDGLNMPLHSGRHSHKQAMRHRKQNRRIASSTKHKKKSKHGKHKRSAKRHARKNSRYAKRHGRSNRRIASTHKKHSRHGKKSKHATHRTHHRSYNN